MREIENEVLAKKINDGWIFDPKIEDPLDDVIEIIDLPDMEHKKSTFPYVKPTVQLPDEIEETQKLIDWDFIDLQTKFDKVNDVATEQKKQKKIEDTIELLLTIKILLETLTISGGKTTYLTLKTLKKLQNILRNIRPVDNRTLKVKTEDDFIPIDDRTRQEPEDDDYNSLESDIETKEIDRITPNFTEEEIGTTTVWDPNKTETAKPGLIIKLSTDYNKKIKAANKIKNRYLRKKIGQRNKSNKISKEWLKTAGYLDTKDQNKINYIFVPPKQEETNEIPGDAGHFIRTEIELTDFKKENLASKIRKNKTRKPYISQTKTTEDMAKDAETVETIKILDDIATLEPAKNAQLAAKRISEKYKKIREANAKKNKYKIPGEIVTIETVKTPDGEVKVPVSIEKPKRSGKETAK